MATKRPGALAGIPVSKQVHLDVRDDIRAGREPFNRIMAAVKALGADEAFVLRAPFEPAPLIAALRKRGFAYWSEEAAPDDWTVWFYREPGETNPAPRANASAPSDTGVVDVRGLEPPEPMVRVLESLDALRPGGRLVVLHERRPMLLYPLLDERGFTHETEEPEPGLVRIVIRRPGSAPS